MYNARNEERSIINTALGIGILVGALVSAACILLAVGYFGLKGAVKTIGIIADRQAESDCIQWAAEAERHAALSATNPGGYYLLKWQKEECDSVNIQIDAPVI